MATRPFRIAPRVTYQLHALCTRNNTILTLVSAPTNGSLAKPVTWVSAGSAGYKGAARQSSYSSHLAPLTLRYDRRHIRCSRRGFPKNVQKNRRPR